MYKCKCGRWGYCPHSPEHRALCFFPECECGDYEPEENAQIQPKMNK